MKSKSEDQQLIEEIGPQIEWYSTAIIRIKTDPEDPQDDHQIGSGTFVSAEGRYGVLTANHVAAELKGHCALGLIIMNDVHRFIIKENCFRVCELATPTTESAGPDLAFIELYDPDLGTIKAHKVFYELSINRLELLNDIPPLNLGAWLVFGVPAEETSDEPPEKSFIKIKGFHGQFSATVASNESQSGEHDYIEIEVEYGKEFHVPRSFRGYSGGGIWQVLLEKSKAGKFVPVKIILSGVAFYQSDIKNQRRYLRCHGRRSIYIYTYDKIKENCH